MKINNKQPWESALTEKTVYASGGFVNDIDRLETDVGIIKSRFPHMRESVRSGYLKDGKYAIIPYRGRYGDGYIFALPHTRSSVRIMYYLTQPKRGV